MLIPLLSILLPATVAAAPADAPLECRKFLVGSWAGKGAISPKMRSESTMTYRADGTFSSAIRYAGEDNKWTEQALAGQWTVTPGRAKGSCAISMKSKSNGGESSSNSTVQMIDKDRYGFWGMEMKRVR